jgi:hypothetical protein
MQPRRREEICGRPGRREAEIIAFAVALKVGTSEFSSPFTRQPGCFHPKRTSPFYRASRHPGATAAVGTESYSGLPHAPRDAERTDSADPDGFHVNQSSAFLNRVRWLDSGRGHDRCNVRP